jgi:hypothetical protein
MPTGSKLHSQFDGILLSSRMAFFAMVLQDRARGYLFCPLPIAAGFLSALLDVLIHALFLAANAV